MSATRLRASLQDAVRVIEHTNASVDLRQAERAVDLLLRCRGRRWFTGVGKSGLAAARMASSLSSIGLAAHFVHGAEWAHGELGGVRGGDVITAVSHSGATAELLGLVHHLGNCQLLSSTRGQQQHHERQEPDGDAVALLALTGHDDSPIAQCADVAVTCAVPPDSELIGLLPTSSLLATHHVFNALLGECAVQVELTRDDVGRAHPGGQIAALAGSVPSGLRS